MIHLGFEPTAELILELLRFLKVPLYAYSSTHEVKTALFNRGEKTFYLVVTNNGKEEKSALIHLPRLENKGKFGVRDLLTGKKETLSSERTAHYTLNIPRKDGRVLEFRRLG